MQPVMPIFYKSNKKNKKYRVEFNLNNQLVSLDFGDKRYQQYRDSTPLKLYSNLDHYDKKRRERYRARASKIRNKQGEFTYRNPMSPNYWSYFYLWT